MTSLPSKTVQGTKMVASSPLQLPSTVVHLGEDVDQYNGSDTPYIVSGHDDDSGDNADQMDHHEGNGLNVKKKVVDNTAFLPHAHAKAKTVPKVFVQATTFRVDSVRHSRGPVKLNL